MVSSQSSVAGFRPRRALGFTGGFFAVGISLSALYATTGVGVPCPFRTLTGWDCPFCGGTRLGSALLHGDLSAAFAANPVVLIGLVVLGVLGMGWTVESLGGPRVRLPEPVAQRLHAVPPLVWLASGLLLAAAYTVLRNLL